MGVVDYHLVLLRDLPRMAAFKRAIDATVQQGDVVIDLGSGSGVLGFMALNKGASKVYFIEENIKISSVAESIAKKNDLISRCVFVNLNSIDAEFCEQADVLVTETIGSMGYDENIYGYVSDLKKRAVLKDGARIIPSNLRLNVMPVYSDELDVQSEEWERLVALDFSPLKRFKLNNPTVIAKKDKLISFAPPQICCEHNFEKSHAVDSFKTNASLSFALDKAGAMNGIAVWFTSELSKNNVIDSFKENFHWQVIAFPFRQVETQKGNRLDVDIDMTEAGMLSWSVVLEDKDGNRRLQEGYSTALADEILPLTFTKPQEFVPSLKTKLKNELAVLAEVDGRKTVADIVSVVEKKIQGRPDAVASDADIAQFVKKTLVKFNLME